MVVLFVWGVKMREDLLVTVIIASIMVILFLMDYVVATGILAVAKVIIMGIIFGIPFGLLLKKFWR